MASGSNPLSAFSDSIIQAVAKGGESTVLVNGRRRIPASGIAYAADLILTADHVIERDEDISVNLSNGNTVSATIAGRDPGFDLALLRVEKANLTPAEISTEGVKVGKIVIALGRPSTTGIEASLGIVYAIGGPARTGRGGMLERYIRPDITLFPGFSGGPLIDTEGRVMGLNTSGLAYGSAITIPADLAWSEAENLAKFGHVKRGYLGVRSQLVSLSPELRKALGREQEEGVLLVSVEPGSPAEEGGLMVGDILVAINDQLVRNHDDLLIHLTGHTVGKPTSIQILRGGQPMTISVIPGEHK
jgi:S1-C subfamily serine protease